MKVDLHMHTFYSDGKLSPEELINEIKQNDIGLFSITDHDVFDGVPEMITLAKRYDLEFVPGVEISTTYLEKEFHLTCYGYDLEDSQLIGLLESNLKERRDFDIKIMTEVSQKYDVDLDDFIQYEDEPKLGGWPSLNYLISKGVVENIKGYFALVIQYGLSLKFRHPKEVISIVKSAGGKVFLAHPSSNQRGGLDESVLKDFTSFGIDGIECFTPYTKTDDEIDYYVDFCKKNNLKISGGSDYHGGFVGRKLGEPVITTELISYDFFKSLLNKVR